MSRPEMIAAIKREAAFSDMEAAIRHYAGYFGLIGEGGPHSELLKDLVATAAARKVDRTLAEFMCISARRGDNLRTWEWRANGLGLSSEESELCLSIFKALPWEELDSDGFNDLSWPDFIAKYRHLAEPTIKEAMKTTEEERRLALEIIKVLPYEERYSEGFRDLSWPEFVAKYRHLVETPDRADLLTEIAKADAPLIEGEGDPAPLTVEENRLVLEIYKKLAEKKGHIAAAHELHPGHLTSRDVIAKYRHLVEGNHDG